MLNFLIGCVILAFCLYVGMVILSIVWTGFMLLLGLVVAALETAWNWIRR